MDWALCREEWPEILVRGDSEDPWDLKAVPNPCDGRVGPGPGGGIRCNTCNQWFCY